MSGEINEVSKAIGGLTSTVEIILENQRKREDIDAAFRRDIRDAIGKMATTTDLKAVSDMAVATKARVDRAGWSLSLVMACLSVLMVIIQNKIREWLG